MLNVVFEKELYERLRERTDVICLPYLLDTGKLYRDHKKRYPYLEMMFDISDTKSFENWMNQQWDTFEKAIHHNESLQIWVDQKPQNISGFYDICKCLQESHSASQVQCVHLPESICMENGVKIPACFAELSEEELQRCMECVETVSSQEINLHYAQCYECLLMEDSLLRVMINGRIRSVDESFYDCWIKAENHESLVEKQGRLLSLELGVNVYWLWKRI